MMGGLTYQNTKIMLCILPGVLRAPVEDRNWQTAKSKDRHSAHTVYTHPEPHSGRAPCKQKIGKGREDKLMQKNVN